MGTKALIFEIIGVDKASATFGRVSTAVAGTTTSMERMQKVGAAAGRVLAIGAAGAAFGLYKAGQAAADDEAAQAQLAQQLKQAAGATDTQIAATEAYITAAGKAKGVSDDELRPALARLATATGDVDKAQRLTTLAMSVSAGTGKSLEQVTTALAKAQNGNIGGLGRLGIATKDAAGHTKTLSQITQDLSDKYKGAAAKAAETTAGKQKILSVQLHELAEQIGAAVLPAMVALSTEMIKVVGFTSQHTHAIGLLLAGLGALLAVTWAVGAATKAWAAVQVIAGAAAKAFAAAQWLVNVALDANPIGLVVIAIAALVAGLIFAYKHCDTFRAIVDKTFSFIGKVVPKIIGEVVNFVKAHWGLLVSIIGGPVAIVAVQVVKHFDTIKAAVGAVADYVKSSARKWADFASNVIDDAKKVVNWFDDFGAKIKQSIGNARTLLLDVGKHLIQGIADGISGAVGLVEDAVKALASHIPGWAKKILGIHSPSTVMAKVGEQAGEGLAVGLERSSGKVDDAAKKLTDKLKARLSSLMEAAASIKSGVASNFAGNMFSASAQAAVLDENGNVVTPAQTVGQNLLSNLHSTSGQLSQLIPAFKQLRKWGWKPGMLAALFQSGGADLIIELASNQGEANEAQGLFGGITKMSNQLGGLVATDVYGDQIDATKHKLHGKGGKGKDDRSERTGDTYNVSVNVPPNADTNAIARETVKMIKRYKREVNGNQELGIA